MNQRRWRAWKSACLPVSCSRARGGWRGVLASILEKRIELFAELFATRIKRDDVAVAADENHRWNTSDAIEGRQWVPPTFAF